jgi:phosphoglycerate dehydrogenase-like enzyme
MRSRQESHRYKVCCLDDDHVIDLAFALLRWDAGPDRDYARRFFRPEAAADDRLAAAGAAVRKLGPIKVERGERGKPSADCDAIVFRRGTIAAEDMAQSPSLKLIQRLGESPHGIDLDEAARRRIAVSCLPRPTLIQVAEHVLMLALALSRKLLPSDQAVRTGVHATPPSGSVSYNWPGLTGLRALYGQTIGIVGMGEIGQLVARRSAAMGLNVLYTSRTRVTSDREGGARWADLDTLLSASDIVTLHVPGGASDGPLIGRREFTRMRRGALFINTARGWLVDYDALYDGLVSGWVGGAALDVYDREPVGSEDRFTKLTNVILTPHLAAGSRLGVLGEVEAMFSNIEEAFRGRSVLHMPIGQPLS